LERTLARGDVREDTEFERIINVQRYGLEGNIFVPDQRAAAGHSRARGTGKTTFQETARALDGVTRRVVGDRGPAGAIGLLRSCHGAVGREGGVES
jgi:hypothetical protein